MLLQVGVSLPPLVRLSDNAELKASVRGWGWSAGEDVDAAWKVFKWDVKNINHFLISSAAPWSLQDTDSQSECEKFSMWSIEIGFCTSWGLIFSHGRSFKDGFSALKFGIDIHGHQTMNIHDFMRFHNFSCSNTNKSEFDLVQHLSLEQDIT